MSISLIPESAPFTEEQRSWLNGFLAGWTGVVESGGNGELPANGNSMATAMLTAEPVAVEEEEEFPWHDPNLEMDERLKLAEGKPLERQMMAAMAQLNCGACGYLCQTYSEAIAAGEEKNLTLCSPGGKDTAKMLKKLKKEAGTGASANGQAKSNGAATNGVASNGSAATNGFSRANPYTARIKSSSNLNRQGSSKHTSHVVIDLGDSGLSYNVGDSLGVYPTNCHELVGDVLACLDDVNGTTTNDLAEKYCLRSVSEELLELLAQKTPHPEERSAVESLVDSDELDTMDVYDVLQRTPSARLAATELMECLLDMSPRLYSIASSHKANPGEVHLTVGRAAATIGGRTYKGVASTMFADRVQPDHPVRVYVHPSHGFTVPSDPSAPMIMVGPGTGIAPFRAFLQERATADAPGKNWLFFGDQHEATDFLYREEFDELAQCGKLTKLSLAFSRDQEQKVYVQDRMREEGQELFAWLEEGGHFFVCGDAKRMAVDVDRALHDVIATHGQLSDEQAKEYVERLKAEGRYVRDVY
ncbi:sulfite reductase subunit alpha [Aeoliella sp. ICT_H6.2]|uniref:assimilatory sulfite reductase (NADPH) n=1 Tax=Aeoliella straminimaris TaxID=2954799 RepID=A0A9X2FBR3_9BACT|nr:sulfite reductase subunit alpha [Aeoliella straminimaris]MCO6045594.1 sulfite reductase subunit alpha [Aeoliella straminimaris]